MTSRIRGAYARARRGRTRTGALVCQALVRRQFALGVLGGVRPNAAVLATAAACEAAAWQLFLQTECCAPPGVARAAAYAARTLPRLAIVCGALAIVPRALTRARRRVRDVDGALRGAPAVG